MQEYHNLFYKIGRTHSYWGRKPISGLSDILRMIQPKNIPKDILWDPLCGGGSAIIAALLEGYRVIASDINPMAVFISRVLISPVNITSLERVFKEIKNQMHDYILKHYSIKCKKCRKIAFIDFIVWEKTNSKQNPKLVKVRCDSCNKTYYNKLSDADKKNQIKLSSIKSKHWFPKTTISSSRKSKCKYHYELFTNRNLAMLSALLNTINNIQTQNLKECFQYIFTAILYSCSKMQMYSEKEKSSSRGWTARRYYIPNVNKEKNVWQSFETRFKNFVKCKQMLNHKIPKVRVTSNQKDFIDNNLEVLLFQSDVFNIKYNVSKKINVVFFDPPYNEYIEYLSFSEFWGSWLKMKFEFNSELLPKLSNIDLYLTNIKKILRRFQKIENPNLVVAFTFGSNMKKHFKDFDLILKKEGFNIDNHASGSFIINANNNDIWRTNKKNGSLKKSFNDYMILRKRGLRSNTSLLNGRKHQNTNIINNENEVLDYLNAISFLYHEEKRNPETILANTLKYIPLHLKGNLLQFFKRNKNNIKNFLKNKKEQKRCYHTFFFRLLKLVFNKDKIKLYYLNSKQFNNNFIIKETNNNFSNNINQYLNKCSAIAIKDDVSIIFSFNDQSEEDLKWISKHIYKNDNNYKLIHIIMTPSYNDMNKYREEMRSNDFPRTFFLSFQEIHQSLNQNNENEFSKISNTNIRVNNEDEFQNATVNSFQATIIDNIPVGDKPIKHYKLKFKTPHLTMITPGQFIMVDTISDKMRRNIKN